jgi:hypothetical protein
MADAEVRIRGPYLERERRYIREYVEERFPDREFILYNPPIGPAPEALVKAHPELSLKCFRRWRPYADAAVVWRGLLVMVEAKLTDPKRGLSALLDYKDQVHRTPELAKWRNRPLQLRLVTPRPDPRLIQVCSTHGILFDVYAPAWAVEYLASRGLA